MTGIMIKNVKKGRKGLHFLETRQAKPPKHISAGLFHQS